MSGRISGSSVSAQHRLAKPSTATAKVGAKVGQALEKLQPSPTKGTFAPKTITAADRERLRQAAVGGTKPGASASPIPKQYQAALNEMKRILANGKPMTDAQFATAFKSLSAEKQNNLYQHAVWNKATASLAAKFEKVGTPWTPRSSKRT